MTSGYDATFLPTNVPLPVADGDTVTLDYPHFSVVLDRNRRLAAVTGVNIDGAQLRDVPRTGDWSLDVRLPAAQQAGNEIYSANDLDRGHLVRRRDPGWGDADTAREATEATFRYPNAAPQASGFNQSKELWLGLEDHVLEYAETTEQRISVFTAPVLASDDPPYRGIQVPLQFWKVVAWQSPRGLQATGFLLDHSELVDVRTGLVKVPPLGGFKTFQVTVAEVAGLTGVDFGRLAGADIMVPRLVAEGSRRLETVDDIVLS